MCVHVHVCVCVCVCVCACACISLPVCVCSNRTVPTPLLSTKQRSVESSRTVHSHPPPQPSQNGANCKRQSVYNTRTVPTLLLFTTATMKTVQLANGSLYTTPELYPLFCCLLPPQWKRYSSQTAASVEHQNYTLSSSSIAKVKTVQLANSSLHTAPESVAVHILPVRSMCK